MLVQLTALLCTMLYAPKERDFPEVPNGGRLKSKDWGQSPCESEWGCAISDWQYHSLTPRARPSEIEKPMSTNRTHATEEEIKSLYRSLEDQPTTLGTLVPKFVTEDPDKTLARNRLIRWIYSLIRIGEYCGDRCRAHSLTAAERGRLIDLFKQGKPD